MSGPWIQTSYPGVRFYKHPTRKNGVNFDRYFTIRYQHKGVRHEEGLGWSSEGWTAERANEELASLKRAARLGDGPRTLEEKRLQEELRRKEEERLREEEKKASIAFGEFFADVYLPHAKAHKKPGTWRSEEMLFRLWVDPVIGHLPLNQISPFLLDKIKHRMAKGEREETTLKKSKPKPLSPKSINLALAMIRQVWNHARRDMLVTGDWPGKAVKKPLVQNKRTRYLTLEEAHHLLEELKRTSPQLHDIALTSLHCGLRAGEIFNLTWDCVDLAKGTLLLVDTKNGETRYAYMTPQVSSTLTSLGKQSQQQNALVFASHKGEKIKQISWIFAQTVKRLGLNDGVTDNRKKVTFHTLRHTFASWLVEAGVDLYAVKELMGHKSILMTQRYAHLGENALRRAMATFIQSLQQIAKGHSSTAT